MNVYLIVHAQEPFLVLSTHESVEEGLVEDLLDMGLEGFLIYGIPSSPIQNPYDEQIERRSEDLDPEGDLEILDACGLTVMEHVELDDLRRVYVYEHEDDLTDVDVPSTS